MKYQKIRNSLLSNTRRQESALVSLKMLLIAFVLISLVYQGCKKVEDPPPQEALGPIVLDCNFFETDQILENDPNRAVDYQVSCVAQVDGEITIKAGVVIEFEDDAGLYVDDGFLKVEGTSSSKVVFTGVNKVKGSWRGIFFESKKLNNILEYAVISYGGGNSFNVFGDMANIVIFTEGKVSISNCEINNGKSDGISSLYRGAEISIFDDNTITANEGYPVNSLTEFAQMYTNSNTYTGNGNDYIFLDASYHIKGNRTWQNNDVPFLIDGTILINNGESLILEAGANLLFEDESSIYVNDGAFLSVEGSSSEKVKLTGFIEQPGSWLGIYNESADLRNVIDHAEIAYAGGGGHNVFNDLGTIVLGSDTYQKVTNSIMRDNATDAVCAINAPMADDTIEVENNTIINIPHEVCDED